MAAAPTRTAASDTPVVGEARTQVNTIRPDWTAGDFESFENLVRHGDSRVITRVNRARDAVPESREEWLRRYGYGCDPDLLVRG